MDIEINEVHEIIKNLEGGGELSIKEEKYLNIAKLCVQLAAENVALKTFCKNAAFDADYEAEPGMEGGGFTDALNNIETPATDRIVAGIKADGVEAFAAYCGEENSVFVEAMAYYRSLPDAAYEFAKHLREAHYDN